MLRPTAPVAVVAGFGPGNGRALVRAFAHGDYSVAALARSAHSAAEATAIADTVQGYRCDVSDEASVAETFARIRDELGPIAVLIDNAGSGVFGDIETITPEQFEAAWRVNAFGALLCSQQVIAPMKEAGSGAIVFIGATASRRGNVSTAAFAPAKAAQRSLAEAMARALWPAGIHVALIVIDGIVETPTTLERMPDRPGDAFIDPAAVAATAMNLAMQDRRGWSFEVEVRSASEKW